MNKDTFLRTLADHLKKHSKSEIESSVSYYSEMIDDRMEDGMNEDEAVASLGEIKDIVTLIEQEHEEEQGATAAKKKSNRLVMIWGSVIAVLVIAAIVCIVMLIRPYGTSETNRAGGSNANGANAGENTVNGTSTASKEIKAIEKTFELSEGIEDIKTCLYAYSLNIEVTDTDRIMVSYQDREADPLYEVFVEDGILLIRLSGFDSTGEFNRLSKEDQKAIHDNKITFTVQIPENVVHNLWVDHVSGDVSILNLNAAGYVELNITSGDLDIRNLQAADLTINAVSGDTIADNINIEGDITVNVTSHSIQMTNVAYGLVMTVNAVSGDVILSLTGDKSDYSSEVNITSGDSNLPNFSREGNKNIEMNITSGDVEVTFLGK